MKKKIMYIIPIVLIGLVIFLNKNYKNDFDEYPTYVNSVEINDKFFNELGEKDTVLFKILNSIDFYDTAKGEFVTKNIKTKETETYKFEADIKNRRLKVESESGDIIIEDNIKYEINKKESKYRKFEINEIDIDKNIGKLKPKDRIVGKKDKEFISRSETPYLLLVNKVLLNEELGVRLLEDSSWELENSENYLGRETVKIEKKLGFTGKSGENNIRVIVDKENGAILKEEILDREGKVVFLTEVKTIKYDEPVGNDFIKNYKDLNEYTLIKE